MVAQMPCGRDGHETRPLGAAKHHRIDRHVLPSACALDRPCRSWRDAGARLATVCAANQASDAKTDCGVNPNHQKAACKHLQAAFVWIETYKCSISGVETFTSAFWARLRKAWSINTKANMASAMGAARKPTQGS